MFHQAGDEALARGARYAAAGADGLFVPGAKDPNAVRELPARGGLPLNVLVVPGLAPVADLATLGVARVSAGSGIAQAAAGLALRSTTEFLEAGRLETMLDPDADYGTLNALFASSR